MKNKDSIMGNRESRNGGDVAALHQGLELLGRGALLVAESSPHLMEQWERIDERLNRVEANVVTLQNSLSRVEAHLERIEDKLARLTDREEDREVRLAALEGCIEKALVRMFPRVETLLAQLEKTRDKENLRTLTDEGRSPVDSFPSGSVNLSVSSQEKRHTEGSKKCEVASFVSPVAGSSNTSNVAYEEWGEATDTSGIELDTALLDAAKEGRADDVHWLITAGANINTENVQHRTPLMLAAYGGHAECLSLLLHSGADAHCRDMNEYLPLHAAACRGHEAAVHVLLQAGVDINAQDGVTGSTALILAASRGHSECVSALLGSCANLELKDDDGMTALHRAVTFSHLESVSLLLDSGANATSVDKRGWSPLDYAFRSGCESVKQIFLRKRRSDVNTRQYK